MMNPIQLVLTSAALVVTTSSLTAVGAPDVAVLGELQQRPGNPAVTPDGTVYFSMHPFDAPEFKVMRLEDGKAVPYPNENVSGGLVAVIGIQATQDHTLWWLDMGNVEVSPKLVGWDTKADKLKAVHVIPNEASVANSFHQDFAIDEKRGKAFIADMSRGGLVDNSEPAIVVIDLKTGEVRRVLSGNKVFQPSDTPLMAEGRPMRMQDENGTVHEIKLGLNPIAIDPSNDWVYFSTMTAGNLYRVSAELLGDFSKSEAVIEQGIEVYGEKPSSDGIATGPKDVVYITNVDDSSIDVVDASGTRMWSDDSRLIWPDGLAVAKDGSVVVTVNQLHRAAAFNEGTSLSEKPYRILRISN